jgi:peptide/nickel transport system permease protein
MTAVDVSLPHRRSFSSRYAGLNWMTRYGLTALFLLLALLIATPWIAPYDPDAQDLLNKLQYPNVAHWLGTDQYGRDVLSRVLHGGLFSVSIAGITLVLCTAIGMAVGAISARQGGFIDETLMRLVDLKISFPDIVVAMFLIAALGSGQGTLIIALTAIGWTPFARMMRNLTLEVGTKEYIEAAEALGCSQRFIILRHILPNAIGPIAAMAFLRFGHMLIAIGGLSFIGLGVQPPASDWGAMLSEARNYMDAMPWLAIAPGLAIFVTALCVTLVGRGLQAGSKAEAST